MVPQKLFQMIGANYPTFKFFTKIGSVLTEGGFVYLTITP